MSQQLPPNTAPSDLRITLLLCAGEILGLSGLATFSALLPFFIEFWNLSNTQAGWTSAVYYGAYVIAVPLLTALTDRRDARGILLLGLMLSAASAFGFAFLARGFGSALIWRFLAGLGLAGVYMPGLKLLSDHVKGPMQSRYISFYTASFSLGTSLSFFLSGEVHATAGWQWAFGLAGILTTAGILLVLVGAPRGKMPDPSAALPDRKGIRAVFRCREAMAYILGYAAHMWELFSMRAWMVAFLAYSQQLQPPGSWTFPPTRVAALINLIGLPASICGNELCRRFDRRRTLIWIMSASALISLGMGFSAPLPYLMVVVIALVYGVTVIGDSASLTAGAVAGAPPGSRGATLAVHSTLGFGAAFLGPIATGVILDLLRGRPDLAWGAAFAVMGAGCAMGPVVLAVLREKSPAQNRVP